MESPLLLVAVCEREDSSSTELSKPSLSGCSLIRFYSIEFELISYLMTGLEVLLDQLVLVHACDDRLDTHLSEDLLELIILHGLCTIEVLPLSSILRESRIQSPRIVTLV